MLLFLHRRTVRRSKILVGLLLWTVAVFGGAGAAHAQIGSERYSSIVIDAANGAVLSAVNADDPRFPASLTKMMTLYMAFEALRDRRMALGQPVPVSAHAASMPPSKLGLLPGSMMTVEEAILGLVTKSANDAAAALGELMGGDEERFAQMMTLRARALGMRNTTFRNASGLPDMGQLTTARDLALLGRRLVQDFPVQYGYFSIPSFRFHGRTIFNHDRMLVSYPGADGIKTGYTEAAGHNLVTSAVRGDVRLVGVVLGAGSNPERDQHMAALLDRGFEQLDVPVAPRRDGTPASRLPALLASAQADTLPVAVGARTAGVRAARPGSHAARVAASAHPPAPPRWIIALGSFPTEGAARRAGTLALQAAGAGALRLEQVSARHRGVLWRVQVDGLTAAEAQAGCHRRRGCAALRADPGQFASR